MERFHLKPCPFCGSNNIIFGRDRNRHVYAICIKCGAEGGWSANYKGAIGNWNMRAEKETEKDVE